MRMWLLAEIGVQESLGRHKTTHLVGEYIALVGGQQGCNLFVAIEVALEGLVDALIHPIFALAVAVGLEIAICLGVADEVLHRVPHIPNALATHTGAGEHLRSPLALGGREEFECVENLRTCEFGAVSVVAIGFGYGHKVGHLHNASLDALQLVAGTGC